MAETSPAPFLRYAQDVRGEIDAALTDYAELGDGCPRQLAEAIRHSLLGPGKRLRPLLVLMSAEACGEDYQRAMPAACAVEMIHAYSLVHDDLPAMDDDDLRRGRPTCHAMFGEALAILAGDALLAQAFELLATGIEPSEVAAKCCAAMSRAAGATALVGGQADDLLAEVSADRRGQLESIHRRKTGAMIRVSLEMGGLISRAGDEQLAALDAYGTKLGLAFQIVDDLLDVQGEQSAMGKRTGKDSGRGKLTFPGVLGVEESKHRAEQLIDQACLALSVFGSRARHLESLARYVLERNQ